MAKNSKLTKKEKITLRAAERLTKQALKTQTQNGLAKLFTIAGCRAIGRDIKAGRKVVGNAEYGFRLCIHHGPRVNTRTGKITPQTAITKRREAKMFKLVNRVLESGGFRPMRSSLPSALRRKDQAFIKRMKKRKW